MVGLGRDYKEKVGLGNVVWILGGKWQFFIFFLPLEENRDCTQRLYSEKQSKGKNGSNSMSQKRKERKRYHQINRVDQCPRTWLSSEPGSHQKRTGKG